MSPEWVIEQLKSIKANSLTFIDDADPECIWRKDVIALDYAIAAIKKTRQPASIDESRNVTP
jgi:uncharacterized membrane-anchored protein